jgi:hypothetical protein
MSHEHWQRRDTLTTSLLISNHAHWLTDMFRWRGEIHWEKRNPRLSDGVGESHQLLVNGVDPSSSRRYFEESEIWKEFAQPNYQQKSKMLLIFNYVMQSLQCVGCDSLLVCKVNI